MSQITFPFRSPAFPFYTGLAESGVIGAGYDVAIGGRSFLIDWKSGEYAMQSTEMIRQQADQSSEAGEQSLSPEDAWRRSQSSWHFGAGQTYFDLADQDGGRVSSRSRFRKSKGIDPWTTGELSLLPDVDTVRTSAATTVLCVPAGSRLYVCDGDTLAFTTALGASPSFTTVTASATSLSSPKSIATDGRNVWVVDSTNLYYTTTAGSTYAAWHAAAWADAYLVRYAKGRLFTAVGANLYNNEGLGSAIPTTALTGGKYATNSAWRWTDVAEGPNAVYACGYVGDKSVIYQTAVDEAGASLTPFVVAGELPDGEIARSMVGYLGGLLIGTDKGVRYGTLDGNGNVILGNLITTGSSVKCFEPQDRFVWFGLSTWDDGGTGLGRVDLRTFATDLTPAWATDLYADETGDVLSVCTFAGRRVFTVSGAGVFAQSDNLVAEGTLYTGWVSYGIVEDKTAVEVATRHSAGPGAYTVSIAADHSPAYTSLGVPVPTAAAESGGAKWPTQLRSGEVFEIRLTLTRSTADAERGPTLKRWTLRAYPAAAGASATIVVPLLLHPSEVTRNSRDTSRNVVSDREYVELLRATGEIVKYQEPGYERSVRVQDFRWSPVGSDDRSGRFAGTMFVQMKVV